MRVVVRVQPPLQVANIPYRVTQETPFEVDQGRNLTAVGLKQDIVGQEVIMDERNVGLRHREVIRATGETVLGGGVPDRGESAR